MSYLKINRKIFSFLACFHVWGCVTPYQEDLAWDSWSDQDHSEQETSEVSGDISEDIRRLSSLDRALSEEDWSYLRDLIEDYGVGPEKDALSVLAAVRQALDEPVEQSEDTESTSLESIMSKAGMDLPSVLESNPYLVSSDFYSLTLRAVERSGNSHDFREKNLEAIRHRTRSWMSLGRALGMADEKTEETVADVQEKTAVLQQISIEDIDQGNLTFEQAQKVSDSGQFQEAIRMLENLVQTSPSHKVIAQTKIKEICNLAVQELRQQAAVAFQNAVPMSNDQARTRYLKSAQGHLQQALTLYPEAENLDTVKENLAVINSTLERMTGQSGSL